MFITPVTYTTQNAYLHSIGVYNCSQWWTGKISPIDHPTVSKLEIQALDEAVALSHIKRLKYSKVAPMFWKMAPDADNRPLA